MDNSRRRRERGEDRSKARPNYRHARLTHLITELVDAVVRDELTDPALEDVVLTRTLLSPDGHHLYGWFVASDTTTAAAALARASALIRTRLADRLGLDRIPHLHFAPDPRGLGASALDLDAPEEPECLG